MFDFSLKRLVVRGLCRAFPALARPALGGPGRVWSDGPWPWRTVAACRQSNRPLVYEMGAPAGLHLVLRLALWPLALVDWLGALPAEMWHFIRLAWRVPNPTPPWPPLP